MLLAVTACGDADRKPTPDQVAAQSEAADQPVVPAEHAQLVGAFHPPFPPGYREVGGWMLRDSLFGITHLAQGGSQVFLLDSLAGRNALGRALWVAVSAVALPAFDSTRESAAALDCAVDGLKDVGVVALGRWMDNGPHARDLVEVRFAARADIARRRFRVVEPGRVACWVEYRR